MVVNNTTRSLAHSNNTLSILVLCVLYDTYVNIFKENIPSMLTLILPYILLLVVFPYHIWLLEFPYERESRSCEESHAHKSHAGAHTHTHTHTQSIDDAFIYNVFIQHLFSIQPAFSINSASCLFDLLLLSSI